jgi:cyclopropane fatty-acyl-phospholipid synthase-like methyltransferase
MTTTRGAGPDEVDLEARVKQMYEEVALHPDAEFHFETGRQLALHLGYPESDLDAIPQSALASFAGVGYFLDLAALQPGERVLDLGSGSGTDSFLAAAQVGAAGAVTGVDMTAGQLTKARTLAAAAGLGHVEFLEGYIESPPAEPASVDCVISNGVVNLSPDKPAVFRGAAGALVDDGRLALADIVTTEQLPAGITCDASLWAACIGGAAQRDDYLGMLDDAGFDVEDVRENDYRFVSERAAGATMRYGVRSISLLARRRPR